MTCGYLIEDSEDSYICGEEATHQCECCKESRWFCSDHGTVGGDSPARGGESQVCGDEYHPNQCWKCGGFNADA